ncbi:MAG TPA: HD domain-containing phosphohydrolase [bacterium]|nr:HD domain-containing phosphohydrolase [bacterium]
MLAHNGKPPKILIVDDEQANVHALERILQRVTRADLRSTIDPRTATALYTEFKPDLVLLDLQMPHLDGFGVLDALKSLIDADTYVPIVMLDGEMGPETKQRVLSSGAKDFLSKPFDAAEVQLRVTNQLETRALQVECEGWRRNARARTRELGGAQLETVERLAMAIEYREDGTGEHTKRVGQWSALLAEAMGLPEANIMEIRLAAPLHDVGKIAIPDRILLKPGKLGAEEWTVMKAHTTIGAKMVSGARNSLLLTAEAIALNHHEKWDGSGYPRNLQAEAIPLPARIVAVADAFDAMTHRRPYREALPEHAAVAELRRCARSHFDPQCVENFLRLVEDPGTRSLLELS